VIIVHLPISHAASRALLHYMYRYLFFCYTIKQKEIEEALLAGCIWHPASRAFLQQKDIKEALLVR